MSERCLSERRGQPIFAHARSIRNAFDRARLRQANRLFEGRFGPFDADASSTIEASDIAASRVFGQSTPTERTGDTTSEESSA